MSHWTKNPVTGPVEYIGSQPVNYGEQLVTVTVLCDVCRGDVKGLAIHIESRVVCFDDAPEAVQAEVVAKYAGNRSTHPAARRFNEYRAAGAFGPDLALLAPEERPAMLEGRADEVLAASVKSRVFAGRPIENVRRV